MLSFIIPAHNEAFELPRCLGSVFKAARRSGQPFEVIVVNDDSTDATRGISEAAGARVVDVKLRKISAVRNAGAKASTGKYLFFVDADTQVSENVVRAAIAVLESGAAGGGAWVGFSEPMGWFLRLGIFLFSVLYMRLFNWAAGCFIFARREAFEAAGGFDERLYACEEIVLSKALKRQGRFVVLSQPVTTSGRKMRMYSVWKSIPMTLRLLRYGPTIFQDPKGLEWWYEGKRENDRPK